MKEITQEFIDRTTDLIARVVGRVLAEYDASPPDDKLAVILAAMVAGKYLLEMVLQQDVADKLIGVASGMVEAMQADEGMLLRMCGSETKH